MTRAVPAPSEQPVAQSIHVRRMDFAFDDEIPRYWFGGDPLRTMLLTALSCTFPEGERMFVRAVRHFEPQIRDATLKKQVKAFIGQESHHGKEHQAFNALMGRKGLPIAAIEELTRVGLAREEQWFSEERMLAKTCALEHFTAMFAEALLAHPELIADIDDRLKPLWVWHALEESEHKAVAFDVFQDQVGSYWVRASEMALTSVVFTLFSTAHTVRLLFADRAAGRPRLSARRSLAGLWHNRRILADLGRHYLSYYRPGFHPLQKDSAILREHGLQMLERLLGDKAGAAA